MHYENKKTFDYSKLNFSFALMVHEAFKKNIKVSKDINGFRLFEKNGKKHLINHQETDQVARVAVQVTNNKYTCKKLLESQGITVPEGMLFKKEEIEKAIKFFKKIKPAVLKPANADYGTLVFLNINTIKDFKENFSEIVSKGYQVLVEKYIEGHDYRIFAARNGFFAATNRIPANITGDGKHTIHELIKIKNQTKRINWRSNKFILGEIKITEVEKAILKEQNLSLNSIPKKGDQIFLRKNANISTGGDAVDVTDKLHPTVKKIVMNVLKAIPGMPYAGIDFLTKKKLYEKHEQKDYAIIEVNNMPGVKLHFFPSIGKSRNCAAAILDMLF